MAINKPLLRFKLCDATMQAIEETASQTHICKSEIFRLAINYALPTASQLDLSSRRSIGAIHYCNAYIDMPVYKQLQELADSAPSAKVGSVARGLIEYAIEQNNFLPTN